MKEITQKIKVVLVGKTMNEDVKKCGDFVREAGAALLRKHLRDKTHYVMSELVKLTPKEAIYKLTLIPNMARLGKEQVNKRVRK